MSFSGSQLQAAQVKPTPTGLLYEHNPRYYRVWIEAYLDKCKEEGVYSVYDVQGTPFPNKTAYDIDVRTVTDTQDLIVADNAAKVAHYAAQQQGGAPPPPGLFPSPPVFNPHVLSSTPPAQAPRSNLFSTFMQSTTPVPNTASGVGYNRSPPPRQSPGLPPSLLQLPTAVSSSASTIPPPPASAAAAAQPAATGGTAGAPQGHLPPLMQVAQQPYVPQVTDAMIRLMNDARKRNMYYEQESTKMMEHCQKAMALLKKVCGPTVLSMVTEHEQTHGISRESMHALMHSLYDFFGRPSPNTKDEILGEYRSIGVAYSISDIIVIIGEFKRINRELGQFQFSTIADEDLVREIGKRISKRLDLPEYRMLIQVLTYLNVYPSPSFADTEAYVRQLKQSTILSYAEQHEQQITAAAASQTGIISNTTAGFAGISIQPGPSAPAYPGAYGQPASATPAKPIRYCYKFFSPAGCPKGASCEFSHAPKPTTAAPLTPDSFRRSTRDPLIPHTDERKPRSASQGSQGSRGSQSSHGSQPGLKRDRSRSRDSPARDNRSNVPRQRPNTPARPSGRGSA